MFTRLRHSICRVENISSFFYGPLELFCNKTIVQFCTPNLRFYRFYSKLVYWGSKKKHRQVKLHFSASDMADPKIEEVLAPLRAQVKEQVG